MIRNSIVAIAAAVASLVAETAIAPALAAETPPVAAGAGKATPIEPGALAILKEMSARLAGAKSLSFHVRRAFDELARDGQPLFYMVGSDVALVRPNRLKVITQGDGPPAEFFYDGQEVTFFLPQKNLAAVIAAPPNIDDALEAAYAKAGVYFPFVDFIVSDPYAAITTRLASAFVVGQSKQVDTTTTDIVAIANPDFQAQLWIGAEDHLPRLVWINPAPTQDKPRNMVEFTNWKVNGVSASEPFRSAAATKAPRMGVARPSGEGDGSP
ncbi:MAG TPA: DUF2092 domain-containing protein [Methylocystis sp.]|nr:DUF2092 domain-containing protein [Methylocystis sp.]